jgi:hypothetical protein
VFRAEVHRYPDPRFWPAEVLVDGKAGSHVVCYGNMEAWMTALQAVRDARKVVAIWA